jgi:SAM-dependent methyltransferase
VTIEASDQERVVRPLSREAVLWTYRTMLGREPEDEAAIARALAHETLDRFAQAIADSPEFRAKHNLELSRVPLESPRLDIEWRTDSATLQRLFDHVARTWRTLGEERPHWSVLVGDQFLPEHVHEWEDVFYASGRLELHRLITTIARLNRSPGDLRTVYEYGCGIGRVTVHLARRFPTITACDISTPHLDLAARTVAERGLANVEFAQATLPELGMHAGFDLWLSRIVLQHNSPPVIAAILQRALSLLNPGGLAIFQVPTYSPKYAFHVTEYLSHLDSSQMEMHVLPQSAIFEIAQTCGCVPLEVLEDEATGMPRWHSSSFAFAKPAKRAL